MIRSKIILLSLVVSLAIIPTACSQSDAWEEDVYFSNIHVSSVAFSGNTTIPIDTTNISAWLPVVLPDGTDAYIPAYK